MIRFILNEMFEDIEVFLERTSSSDHTRSSMFYSLQFYNFTYKLLRCCVLHYVIPKIEQFPFIIF